MGGGTGLAPTPHTGTIRVVYTPVALHAAGSERQMLALARRLPPDRFEVEFVLLSSAKDFPVETDPGVPSLFLDLPRGDALPVVPFKVVRGVAKIRVPHLRRRRIDIVDAWQHHGAILTALTRPATRYPVLIGGRRNLGEFRERFNPVERAADQYATRSAAAIVANSQIILERVARREQIDPSKLRMIHNGVEEPAPMSREERQRLRQGWSVDPDDVLLGCVSNYRPGKALDRLISTVMEAHKVRPQNSAWCWSDTDHSASRWMRRSTRSAAKAS